MFRNIRWASKAKRRNLHNLDDDNCELHENVAYFTTSHYEYQDEGSAEVKEEDGCNEEDIFANGELEALELEQATPQIPSREYLQEDKVCRQTLTKRHCMGKVIRQLWDYLYQGNWTHVDRHIHTHTRAHIHTYTHTHTVHVCVCMHSCVCRCVCNFNHICA